MTTYQSIGGTDDRHSKVNPGEAAGIFSKAFFIWANGLMKKANAASLTSHDLWCLPSASQAKAVGAKFEPSFRQTRSIVTSYLSIFGWRFLFIGFLQVLIVAGTIYGPIVLQLVMELLEQPKFDTKLALLYAGSLFCVRLVQSFIGVHTTFQCEIIALRFQSALQQLLFQKALVLDSKSRREKSSDVTQLFTTEVMWIVSFSNYTHQIWIIPCQLGVVLYLLYNVLGYAAFVGAGIIVITLVLNNSLAHGQRGIWRSLMQQKEKRMKVLQEVFTTILDRKLETSAERQEFQPEIFTHRGNEIKTLWSAFSLSAIITAILYTAPIFVTVASLAFYTLVMHQTITATKVFTALALFRSLRAPLIGLPQITAHLMQAFVAARRLREFLNLTEKDPNVILTHQQLTANQYENFANNNIDIAIEDGSFGWDADKPMFRRLNLFVKRSELIIIHGENESGKSSLCNVILGELERYEGSIFVGGRIAYCSEEPWIQHTSIRENILFGKPYERKKYNLVLEACGLRPAQDGFPFNERNDILPNTLISNEDKIRISLARACYNDADIYILDIPIPQEVFNKCILGFLQNKTILLVSEDPTIIESKYIDKSFNVTHGTLVENPSKLHLTGSNLLPPLASRKRFWEEEPHILEQEVPDTQGPIFDTLISPSLRSPFGMLTEEPSFPMDEMAGTPDEDIPTRNVFWTYFQSAGWCLVVFLILVQCMWQSLQIMSDLWLSHWCTTSTLGLWRNGTMLLNDTAIYAQDTIVFSKVQVMAYSKWNMQVYAVLAGCCMLMVIFRTIITSCAGIHAANNLFNKMTISFMETPYIILNKNPIEKILNIYSGDINLIDTRLPFSFGGFLANFFIIIFLFLTILISLKFFGLILFLYIFFYFYFGIFYILPGKEIENLIRITRQPYNYFINETLNGVVIIRSYGMKQIRRFYRIHQNLINEYQETLYTKEIFKQWFLLRMQIIHSFFIFNIIIILIGFKSNLTPGLFGLVFNYALQIPPHFEYLFLIWSNILSSMSGVQRILGYIQWKKNI